MSRAGPLRLVINIPAFRLYVYRGGVLWRDYPVAVGKASSPSLVGTCRVVSKVTNPTWYPPDRRPPVPPGPNNPLGSRWIGLSVPGYGIHGNNNPASIGRPASLGCVRMLEPHVRELFDLVPIGTPVEFRYDTAVTVVDGSTGCVQVTAYRDLYGWGARDPTRLAAEVGDRIAAEVGWRPFGPALLAAIQEGAGQPRPVYRAVTLVVGAFEQLPGPKGASVAVGALAADTGPGSTREVGFAERPGGPAPEEVWVSVRSVAEALGVGLDYSGVERAAVESGAYPGTARVKGRLLAGRLYVRLSDLPRAFPKSLDCGGTTAFPASAPAASSTGNAGVRMEWDAAACVVRIVRQRGGVRMVS